MQPCFNLALRKYWTPTADPQRRECWPGVFAAARPNRGAWVPAAAGGDWAQHSRPPSTSVTYIHLFLSETQWLYTDTLTTPKDSSFLESANIIVPES